MSRPLTAREGWVIYTLLLISLIFSCCTIHTHIDTAVSRVEAKLDVLKKEVAR